MENLRQLCHGRTIQDEEKRRHSSTVFKVAHIVFFCLTMVVIKVITLLPSTWNPFVLENFTGGKGAWKAWQQQKLTTQWKLTWKLFPTNTWCCHMHNALTCLGFAVFVNAVVVVLCSSFCFREQRFQHLKHRVCSFDDGIDFPFHLCLIKAKLSKPPLQCFGIDSTESSCLLTRSHQPAMQCWNNNNNKQNDQSGCMCMVFTKQDDSKILACGTSTTLNTKKTTMADFQLILTVSQKWHKGNSVNEMLLLRPHNCHMKCGIACAIRWSVVCQWKFNTGNWKACALKCWELCHVHQQNNVKICIPKCETGFDECSV